MIFLYICNLETPNHIERMKRILITLAVLSLLSFTNEPLLAERLDTIKDTLKKRDLNTLVVTSGKTAVKRNNVPVSISVVESEDIEASGYPSVLPALSRLVPGLFVTQKGIVGFGVAEGAAGNINIRGVGQGNKVLMLLDGQPQWAGVFGHSIPDLYPSADVERVEVLRGPASLIYGSNAMGGAINVITKKSTEDGYHGRFSASYGSHNTGRFLFNSGYSKGKFSAFFSVNHDRTNGHRENSRFDMTNGFAKLGYRISSHFSMDADLSLASIYNENPGMVGSEMIDNNMDIFRASSSVSLKNNYKLASGALQFFFNQGRHEINDGYTVGGVPKDYLFNSLDHNFGLMFHETFELFPGNRVTIGADFKNWGGKAWQRKIETTEESTIADKSIEETAAYVVVQHDFFDKLTLNGGVRFEYNSVFGDVWIPQLGVSLRSFEGNVVRVSVSKGYRSPTIKEMYMFPPQNPDLQPESMVNLELSVSQSFFDSDLLAEMSLYYIDGWNMIELVKINGMPKNLNTGFFDNRGVDLMLSYRILPELRADLNYSYLNTSKPILAAPKHKTYLGVLYSKGPFVINSNIQHIEGMYTNVSTKSRESYILLNANVSYKTSLLGLDSRFFVNGDNLTGASYAINEGFPMPGVAVMLGVDINF